MRLKHVVGSSASPVERVPVGSQQIECAGIGDDGEIEVRGINVFKDEGGGALANSTIQCPGYNDIGVDAAGYCTVTAGNGDKLFLKWSCKATAPAAGDLAACEGAATVVGGTGAFEKATGGNEFSSHVRGVNADGTTMGYSELRNYVVNY